jgi:hypothetical protein
MLGMQRLMPSGMVGARLIEDRGQLRAGRRQALPMFETKPLQHRGMLAMRAFQRNGMVTPRGIERVGKFIRALGPFAGGRQFGDGAAKLFVEITRFAIASGVPISPLRDWTRAEEPPGKNARGKAKQQSDDNDDSGIHPPSVSGTKQERQSVV